MGSETVYGSIKKGGAAYRSDKGGKDLHGSTEFGGRRGEQGSGVNDRVGADRMHVVRPLLDALCNHHDGSDQAREEKNAEESARQTSDVDAISLFSFLSTKDKISKEA